MDIIYSRDITIDALAVRRQATGPDVSAVVRDILAAVRERGDEALRDYAERFDGFRPASLRVAPEDIAAARRRVGPEFLAVLEEAAANIRAFHSLQRHDGFEIDKGGGIVMGQKYTPIERAGVYVPGGTAPYPSTVLMDVIPAQIAGVGRIVMATPPGRGGRVDDGVLAAASVAGATEIYMTGGAQAIAALAYGTETVPCVDKIVGPGNAYVAEAKRQVFGLVGIDMIAGPSDILVVADVSANPAFVAADMLGQAEHDRDAAAVLVTDSAALAEAVRRELVLQLPRLPRADIAGVSLERNGRIIVAGDISEALAIADALAPEHLELCLEDAAALLPSVRNAGSIFLGHYTPEALGDYFAGPNHTLPTYGTARFCSPLSVDDFVKKSSYLGYSREALAEAGGKVIAFARRESLDAHANSVALRVAPDQAL